MTWIRAGDLTKSSITTSSGERGERKTFEKFLFLSCFPPQSSCEVSENMGGFVFCTDSQKTRKAGSRETHRERKRLREKQRDRGRQRKCL